MSSWPSEDPGRAAAAYEAFNRRAFSEMLAFFAPDCVWRDDPFMPEASVWHGHAGLLDLIASWDAAFGEFAFHVERIEQPAPDRLLAIVCASATGSSSGAMLKLRVAHVIALRGGLASEVAGFLDLDEARAVASRSQPS